MNNQVRRKIHLDYQFQDAPQPGITVFTNGCFDILHKGHKWYLKESRQLGDRLIVGLNSDESVRKLKGAKRPVNTWQERALALAELPFVNLVIKFDEDTPLKLIKVVQPDIITKGGDYNLDRMIGREYVESYGGQAIIISFLEGFSSSSMIE